MVFCGECGSPVASGAAGDRSARLPPVGRANTLVGALPGIPVTPSMPPAPPVPSVTTAKAPEKPPEKPPEKAPEKPPAGVGGRATRPFDDSARRTVMGMPVSLEGTPRPPAVTPATLVSPTTSPDREAKSGRSGGRKGRRGSSTGEAKAAPVSEEAPHIEVSSLSEMEAHDAGWTTAAEPPAPEPPAEPPPPVASPVVPGEARPATVPPAPIVAEARPATVPPAPIVAEARPATVPPAPTVTEAGAQKPAPPQDTEEEQRLLDDLDAGFESIVRPSSPLDAEAWGAKIDDARWTPEPPATPGASEGARAARAARHEADMAEVRALFAGIAVAYARPLRDFMIELAWGEPTREWLDVAVPAALALRRAAAAVELPELDAALEGYGAALELAAGEAALDGGVREMIEGAYARLVEAMPGVFALEGERGRREPVIVRSLLLQVPGVRKVAIDKLYAAGINGLDVFYAARPRELAEATGLEEAVTAAICERFQRYKRELAELSPGKSRERERAELGALTAELHRHHEAHERAAAAWSKDAAARRAEARKDRADTALRIDVLLAHLGEVDLLQSLAKVPFQQKIRELQRYLDEATQKALPPGAPPPLLPPPPPR